MFYYIDGIVTVMEANLAVLDCGGVGYACHTTGYTLSQLQIGKKLKLYTYCNIKEDAFDSESKVFFFRYAFSIRWGGLMRLLAAGGSCIGYI